MTRPAARPGPEEAIDGAPATLDGFVGYTMKRAYMVLHEDYRRALGADGLSPRAFSALSLVVEQPGLKQTAVAHLLGVNRSGVVAIVDDLDRKGLVERVKTEGDRRALPLFATARGRLAHRAARQAIAAHEDRLLSDFSAAERQSLLALLLKIRARGET